MLMTTPERAPAQDGGDDFRVLFVCTGNLCRSPMAELLFDRAVAQAWSGPGRWLTESAGTAARDGQLMHPHAAAVLGELKVDGSTFRTRRLRASMLQIADLVLTATREHRSVVAQMYPRGLGRLFTVNQFAHLLAHSPTLAADLEADTAAEAGAMLIEMAKAARTEVPARSTDDDLTDPVDQPVGQFRHLADVLRDDFDAVRPPLNLFAS